MDNAIERRLAELGVGEAVNEDKKCILNNHRLLRDGEVIKGSDELAYYIGIDIKWKKIIPNYPIFFNTKLDDKNLVIRRKVCIDIDQEEIGE